MDTVLHLVSNLTMMLLLSIALLILWSPVIIITLYICFALFGKAHLLKLWLNKCGFTCSAQFWTNRNSLFSRAQFKDNNFNGAGKINLYKHSYGLSRSFSATGLSYYNRSPRINPASGLPMAGSLSIDSAGNTYGTRKF
jgi:hypothetical protein